MPVEHAANLARAKQAQYFEKIAERERSAATATANQIIRATRDKTVKLLAYQVIADCLCTADSLAELDLHLRRLSAQFKDNENQSHKLH